ncbi:MAG TPA: TIGR02996 domain-containing protein [Urbifossiella sp.]|jgi:uncharacterized protein (TIGR02996 family)|nr:TIGR02996 domain-containing protein [Urbifossiella sp.]
MGDDEFLRAILANPKHDTPLLVYADWLEERNTPDAAARVEYESGGRVP